MILKILKWSVRALITLVVWLYSGLIVGWFILHKAEGDQRWWMALLNTAVPYLFAPLVLWLPFGVLYRRREYWLGLMPAVGLFLWLYGQLFLPHWPSIAHADNDRLTIMTFNIWGYSYKPETAQAIRETGPADVVVIQELSHPMEETLVKELSDIYPYHVYGTHWYDRSMGVFSRYPLEEIDASELGNSGWLIQKIYVRSDRTNNQDFVLYNVHPDSTHLRRAYTSRELVIREIEQSFQRRARLIQILLDDISRQSAPVIVAGDFNSTDQNDVYDLMSKELTDAHRAAGWGFGHTFPAYTGRFHSVPIFARQIRIDMIFFSPDDFEALKTEVGQIAGESDHLPVIVELRRK
jgi:endonuclease/exonuclease/phosphatase (EEP) superfamily protein YafD